MKVRELIERLENHEIDPETDICIVTAVDWKFADPVIVITDNKVILV